MRGSNSFWTNCGHSLPLTYSTTHVGWACMYALPHSGCTGDSLPHGGSPAKWWLFAVRLCFAVQ